MKKLLLSLLIASSFAVTAQEKKEEPKYGITFSGFVRSDYFYDTRQNVSIREGDFLLYPTAISLDSVGEDINATPNLNFLSIQSRLSGKITGPDAFGAKTSGLLEADFFGNENTSFADLNGFRLRHAFAKLSWKKTELLFGQYWHPLFNVDCFPGVTSFNTGAPFQPFSRNPQIRATHKIGKLSLMAVASTQRDFTSLGGSTALRNSAIPEMNAQIQYATKNDSTKTEFLFGVGGGYKILNPGMSRTAAGKVYKVNESFGNFVTTAFVKVKIPAATIKLQGVYGQNLADLVMLGGYAIDTIADATTGELKYAPYNTLSAWLDASTNGDKIQFGLFVGYSQNLGVSSQIMGTPTLATMSATTRGYNIKNVMRASPRVTFISGKFKFSIECEYTSTAYATKTNGLLDIDKKGVVTKSENVSNIRGLLAVIYSF